MLEGITEGIVTVFTWLNICYVFLGCFAGTFIGMLPGLGPVSAIALMVPLTYTMAPASGMILMAGVYYGAIFGGSTSSILLNAPGVSGTVATAFDGYPMAQQGMAGKALAIAAYASFAGGTIATFFLLAAAPLFAKISLTFQSADYFALMVLGLTAVATFSHKGKTMKSLLMAVLGLMIATIGTDQTSGLQRFTFGQQDLSDGISFLVLSMASFALAEALSGILTHKPQTHPQPNQRLGSLKLSSQEAKEMLPTVGRSSILGFFVGVLPGAGATIASFLAYGLARSLAPKDRKDRFGHGCVEGLAAPETANNAACSGSFVPLLTLGIPGSGTTAVLLGALLSYGIQPGPRLYIEHPAIFWSVIISMYVGNLILLVLNLPLIPYIARLLHLPRTVLVPYILFFSLIGVYLVSFNPSDLLVMSGLALFSLCLRYLDFPIAPMLLGFILGGMIEDNLRRALILSDGSYRFLYSNPLTMAISLAVLGVVGFSALQSWRSHSEPPKPAVPLTS